jgi:hypothetical protein
MQVTLENIKKAATDFPSVLKKNNKVEEGEALGLGLKREQKNTNLKAQKMMRGRVEPSIVLTMVHVVK